ncbi:MAG: SpoIID/LytB domain-containing protein [Bacteroidales bacterium]|nr:SpoIID/LytB domain-containing protein [Bacteroidales bacterium]
MRYFFAVILFSISSLLTEGQVRIRLFASQSPVSVIFRVTTGSYSITDAIGKPLVVNAGEPVLISRYGEKVAMKVRNREGYVYDTLKLEGLTGNDNFSLSINGPSPLLRIYSGDLHCFYDLDNILLINVCIIEEYIAGVVRTEGGEGRNIEYFRTQALLARTYMFRYFEKHAMDNFNLCDDTHCQAFNGVNTSLAITSAVEATRGLVVLGPDSILISPAFHSNCGGETALAEDVWLSGQPYLKKVKDPHCTSSGNATWQKRISLSDWISYMKKSGYSGSPDNPAIFAFSQPARVSDYRAGSFTVPLKQIRNDYSLRSTFFSVIVEGDSVLLKGRGYGHGVGLCQEGAMRMALKGSDYKKIVDFYYNGVIISDIENARQPEKRLVSVIE